TRRSSDLRALRLENRPKQEEMPSLISASFAQRMKIDERLANYYADLQSTAKKDLTAYRKKYYEQLYTWNKSGVVGTKLSLRYSLWDRDPTNDLNVIRFCLSVPEEQYARGGMSRSLLRRAMKGRLPNSVRLNEERRGLQAVDVIERMTPKWSDFIRELEEM